jgi:hypothetical protein
LKESVVKITVAADNLGVTYKTIYNWLEDGSLKLVHPGFVDLLEARQVWIKKQSVKSSVSKITMASITRDEYGRFKTVDESPKRGTYKDLD